MIGPRLFTMQFGERQAASAAFNAVYEQFAHNYMPQEFFIEGYAAACERSRVDFEELQFGKYGTRTLGLKLAAERMRSQKLAEALRTIINAGYGPIVNIDCAAKALAEYEVSND